MPDTLSIVDMTLRMLLAVVVGGLVGYERETHGRPAGLRTHILVCLGSALFTITSIQMAGIRYDPGRIAAQIVSGIGFLGAGTIIRQGSVVRGLTTAASLWTVAAIGIAVGIGRDNMAFIAVIASVVVFATLSTINRFEHKLIARRVYRDLIISLHGGRGSISTLLGALSEQEVDVVGVETEEAEHAGVTVFRFHLRLPTSRSMSQVNENISLLPQVESLHWD